MPTVKSYEGLNPLICFCKSSCFTWHGDVQAHKSVVIRVCCKQSYGCAGRAQYGGSEAHAAVFQRQRGDWQPATRLRDKLISLRRAISNGWCAAALAALACRPACPPWFLGRLRESRR